LSIVDLGSGATFFPFALARLGLDVTAVDLDPVGGECVQKASKVLTTGNGHVQFLLGDIGQLPIADDTFDVAYSISTLEHTQNPEVVVEEVARLLPSGGLFLLTFDVDLRGDQELSPTSFKRLMESINMWFENAFPVKLSHPLRYLTVDNSPYPAYYTFPSKVKRSTKEALALVLSKHNGARSLESLRTTRAIIYCACLYRK
jgi:ubiquinone/menaquinone biosynthesis C-methylase UbiE